MDPSYRAPTPTPLRCFAQSVITGVHSATIVRSWFSLNLVRFPAFPHNDWICSVSLSDTDCVGEAGAD